MRRMNTIVILCVGIVAIGLFTTGCKQPSRLDKPQKVPTEQPEDLPQGVEQEVRPSTSDSENNEALIEKPLIGTPAPSSEPTPELSSELDPELSSELASELSPELFSEFSPGSTEGIVESETVLEADSSETLTSPIIIVKKGERQLELWDGDRLYDTYPIGLGWEPTGDKKVEGDGRTPEGTYYVCVRNSKSRFYLSLGVSYPNKEDAREALEEGTIDLTTYKRIEEAIDRKSTPPWKTAMGGEIMIHGMGGSSDWTAGCVAVDNDIMDILWKHCPVGTPIHIEP